MSSESGRPEGFIGPLLKFDTDDPEFARGFELGFLWARTRDRKDQPVEEYAHATNAEMVLRIAEATGRRVVSEELGGGWLNVRFEPPEETAEESLEDSPRN